LSIISAIKEVWRPNVDTLLEEQAKGSTILSY